MTRTTNLPRFAHLMWGEGDQMVVMFDSDVDTDGNPVEICGPVVPRPGDSFVWSSPNRPDRCITFAYKMAGTSSA